MLGTAEEVNRVTTQPDFQHHIHGLMTDTAPRFRSIVDHSFAYTTIRDQIISQLDQDFSLLEKQAKKAEECRDIYKFMITFDFEEDFKSTKPTIDSIKQQFDQYKRWDAQMNKSIPNNFAVGII